jgi:uncharacterized protein YegL
MSENLELSAVEFAGEPKRPCVLLLDTSRSMQGSPIRELNSGLGVFRDAIAADPLAVKRVEVAVVSFGGAVRIESDFKTVDAFAAPTLEASGDAPIGAAIELGPALLEKRKQTYKANDILSYRPLIVLITNGRPSDAWKGAAEGVHQGSSAKAFLFMAYGLANADHEILKQIAEREPLKQTDVSLQNLLVNLADILISPSWPSAGEQVCLANPAMPKGWTSV